MPGSCLGCGNVHQLAVTPSMKSGKHSSNYDLNWRHLNLFPRDLYFNSRFHKFFPEKNNKKITSHILIGPWILNKTLKCHQSNSFTINENYIFFFAGVVDSLCSKNPCQNVGKCIAYDKCYCPKGWFGLRCEYRLVNNHMTLELKNFQVMSATYQTFLEYF